MTSTILLNDFKRQWSDTCRDVVAAVEAVGASGWYILGESVSAFEKSLAAAIGTKFTVGCASGLDAIEIALRALGIQRGARVLTTPLSAFATTLAVHRAGAVPVFVDVDVRGNIDLEACETLLAARSDIRCVLPVHLYGHPVDLDRLARLKQRFGILVVEDCAQAIGGASSSHAVGTVGDIAAFSFYPTKNLGALGDGGAIATNDAKLHNIATSLRNYGQSARYVHDRIGLNSRLDELHAAILDRAFLPKLPEWTERRRNVAARYTEGIKNPAVRILSVAESAKPAWHLFAVEVAASRRVAFQEHLRAAGVQSAVHYPTLITDQVAMREMDFEIVGDLKRARELATTEVSLPMHPYLEDGDLARVIDAVNRWHS